MSNLGSFAQLVKQANEDKRIKEEEESNRKREEITPLLSELFSSVVKGKELRQESILKEAPLLDELQSALLHPEKFKLKKEENKQKIVALVTELENNAIEASGRVSTQDISNSIGKAIQESDKRFLKLFNRLQSDLQALKRNIDSKAPTNTGGYGGGGSGEVRILRMDDMSREVKPTEGDTLVWSSALNKFTLSPQIGGSGGATIYSDEEMPFAKRVDFVSDSELYKGEALVGASEAASLWRIRKVTISLDSDVSETWAGGTAVYDKRWSDRLAYTYI